MIDEQAHRDFDFRLRDTRGKIPDEDFNLLTSTRFAGFLLEYLSESTVVVINAKAQIIYVSERAERLLNIPVEKLIGQNYFERVHIYDEDGIEIPVRKRLAWEALNTANYKRVTPFFCYYGESPHSRFQVAMKALAIEANGKVTAVILTIREVKRVLNIDEMKTLFVSFAAHQLKTPSSITKGFLELLVREGSGNFKKNQWHNLQSAYEANESLINLSKALLNLTRLEGGLIEPKISNINPTQIIEEKILAKQLLCRMKNIEIRFETKDEARYFETDELIFSELFDIVFSNAIKFSPNDSTITITLKHEPDGLFLSVSDHGPGMSEEQQERLFTTASKPLSAEAGHGLGLIIAKKYLALLRGSISVQSHLGDGTIFTIRLPKNIF